MLRRSCIFPQIRYLSSKISLPSHVDDVYVVSGGSRGIGLNFTKQLLKRSQGTVIALSRRVPTDILENLRCAYPDRLHVQQMDLEDFDSIETAASEIKKEFSRIDLLLNVSGVLYDDYHMPERSVSQIDPRWMAKSFQV